MKKLVTFIGYLFSGIAWGCTVMVVVSLVASLAGAETFLVAVVADYPRQAVGAMITGIGFSLPALIYRVEKLNKWQQVGIHFVIGMGVYLPVAFYLGWIPLYSKMTVLVCLSIAIAFFIAIWLCFFLYYRWEAKQMNNQLKKNNSHKITAADMDKYN